MVDDFKQNIPSSFYLRFDFLEIDTADIQTKNIFQSYK